MATYTLVKFKNMTPLHIGTGKENYDFSSSDLHSDTLSAALAALKMQVAEGDDLMSFLESFVVSSLSRLSEIVIFFLNLMVKSM